MAIWTLLGYVPLGFLPTNQELWAQKFSEPKREIEFHRDTAGCYTLQPDSPDLPLLLWAA
jgi:hypothetical protein